MQTFEGHTAAIATVRFSPNGQQLISGGFDQTIQIWDIATGKSIQVLQGHTGIVSTLVCQSVNLSSECVRGGGQNHACLSGSTLRSQRDALSPPASCSIFSGSFDETIKCWSLETRSCHSTLRVPRPYEGMNISHTTGLNEAQRVTLSALGATSDKS
ncbi:hypothetical protein K9N68_01455 [Kovacikia minuta CCNUW1]|nr:hypothetical protein K9N68_01455 [Kovacikia minuta CCNUW1]